MTIVIFWLIQSFVAQPFQVKQQSMQPTFIEGQYVLVDKLSPHFDSFSRGDVVIFNPVLRDQCSGDAVGDPVQPDPFIKRVIGEPGDFIQLVDGRVQVNGVGLAEPYVHDEQTVPLSGETQWTVPTDRLLVMGDNRENSIDSRSDAIGLICIRDVIGRAWLRYWPINTVGIIQTPTYPGVPTAPPQPSAPATP